MVCSVGMMVFNKLAVTAFPLECTLVAAQMAFTALSMVTVCWGSIHIGSFKDMMRWCMVVPFFTGIVHGYSLLGFNPHWIFQRYDALVHGGAIFHGHCPWLQSVGVQSTLDLSKI